MVLHRPVSSELAVPQQQRLQAPSPFLRLGAPPSSTVGGTTVSSSSASSLGTTVDDRRILPFKLNIPNISDGILLPIDPTKRQVKQIGIEKEASTILHSRIHQSILDAWDLRMSI